MTNQSHETINRNTDATEIAYKAAVAELPFRELQKTARGIGHSALADEMDMRANQASDAVMAELSVEENVDAPMHVPELELDHETLLELLRHAPIALSSWFSSTKDIPEEFGGGHLSGFSKLFSGIIMNPEKAQHFIENVRTSDNELLEFADEGVPEVVTFTKVQDPSKRYGAFSPDSPYADEAVVVMTYETVTRVRGGHGKGRDMEYQFSLKFKDGYQRPGQYLAYHLWLPESQAVAIQSAMKADLNQVHDLSKTILTEHFGLSQEDWGEYAPDYDAWREISGGSTKIAFKGGLGQPTSRAEIIAG